MDIVRIYNGDELVHEEVVTSAEEMYRVVLSNPPAVHSPYYLANEGRGWKAILAGRKSLRHSTLLAVGGDDGAWQL